MLPYRLHIEEINNKKFDLNRKYIQYNIPKPNGLWYSIRDSVKKLGDWFGTHAYEIKIKNNSNILKIKTYKDLLEFENKYKYKNNFINWKKVAKDYDGIEFLNYDKLKFKSNWYNMLDFNSGCIWNLDCIKSIEYYGKLKLYIN